jgi:O-antigen/teichoic acid export membrane protein
MNSKGIAPEAPGGFADRVRAAVFWRWGSQVLSQVITWAATILIVRLLDPKDYGLFAMTQAVLTALNFLNGYGFATALIQTKDADKRRVGQVFGLLIVANLVLATGQFLAAPLAAAYYGQPMVTWMLRVQALMFLTTPFIALPSVLLQRQLDFRRQALVNLLCSFAGAGVGLTLASIGYGPWALVWAPIAMFATRALGLTIACGGLVRPVFDFRGGGDLVTFGAAFTLSQLFWIVQSQADIVIAGRSFSPHNLGLYSEALFLVLIFTGRFLPPLNEVAYPAYAELKSEGKPVGPAFLQAVKMIMLIAVPFYIGLSMVAGPLVVTFFGSKWLEMIPIVAGLAAVMPAMTLQIVCSPATNGLGKPRIYLTSSICGAIIMPIAFLIGSQWGAAGLVMAWQVAAPLLLLVTLALTLPAVEVSWQALAAAIAPSLTAALAMSVVVSLAAHYTNSLAPQLALLLLAVLGASTYFGVLLAISRPMLRELYGFVARKQLVAH